LKAFGGADFVSSFSFFSLPSWEEKGMFIPPPKRLISSFTRDASGGGSLGSATSPNPIAVPFVEWQARECIYKSSETDGLPSAKP
jgi:hypothetical protein